MPKATRAAETLNATPTDEDRKFDLSLRPTHISEYIGQTKAKENLRIYIKAATKRREALDHVLLTGLNFVIYLQKIFQSKYLNFVYNFFCIF